MKKNLTHFIIGLGMVGTAMAQTIVTGPSSSQSSYLTPLVPSSTITSILTATNVIGGYTMCGTPDGIGAFDNNDGTFTLLMNHEFGNTAGGVRAHGQTGAFVSKWIINKTNLSVVSGSDLIQNVNLWTGTTYTTYNAANTSTLAAFGRFCSADLPAVSAFYNAATGKGTQDRIFMNGEESGNEGRAFAHIATGTEAGNTYELPFLGKASFENHVACPNASDKTIVVGLDDTTPGQIYVYVGTKTSTGNVITKAGLTGGKLYGVAVLGLLNEASASIPPAGTMFNLIDLGNVSNTSGATINTNSNNMGVTNFLRPEDGAWDPSNPKDFYFATTNSFANPSRIWRLRFTNINQPELGGTITAVLDGTEGQKMADNIGIDHYGHMMIVEDVGGNAHNGKVWDYNIATDALTLFAEHDTTRFITGGSNFLTIDEEASGVIDAQEILGAGMFLVVDQTHYGIPAPIVEGGQILAFYNPASALANPEINVQGNSVSIPSGNTAISAGNNTGFGSVNLSNSISKTFVIQNSGPGVLSVKSISVGGMNAGDFLATSALLPATVAVNGTLNVFVQFSPGQLGTRSAMIYLMNNDFNESVYSFAIEGVGTAPEINLEGNSITISNGNTAISTTDNTDFGSTFTNIVVNKSFNIQNTGTGPLNISGMMINGANANSFSFVNPPVFPLSLAAGASQAFSVDFIPTTAATHSAMIVINNTDANEGVYSFNVEGKGMMDVGIKNQSKSATFVTLYPNPAKDEAIIKLSLETSEQVVINVYDVQGKKVMSAIEKNLATGESEINLNTTSLKNGNYIVEVSTSNKINKIKMLVAH